MDLINDFLNIVDSTVSEEHKVSLLDVALQEKPTMWRGSHYNHIRESHEIKIAMRARF